MKDEYFEIPLNVWAALTISLLSTIALLFLPSFLEVKPQIRTVQVGLGESPKKALSEQKDLLTDLEKKADEIKKKCDKEESKEGEY